MSFKVLTRNVARFIIGLVALALVAMPVTESGASQSKPLLPTKAIVTGSNKDLGAIRTFFFCQTKACKKTKTADKAAADVALSDIKADIKLMKADDVPPSQLAIVVKYEVDAKALIGAYTAYPKQTGADDEANNIGIIYYQTSNLGSDDYLLGCAQTKTAVVFKEWSVGVVGVAYAMQVDTQAETSTAPAPTILSANKSLLAEAASMKNDANGPNAQFNKLLIQFANTQAIDSRDTIAIINGKGKSITKTVLTNLAKKLTSEFKVLSALQNKLAA
ncbi:MAG: hypothetical protein ABSE75_04630 [Acidimicrobiales bacterium]